MTQLYIKQKLLVIIMILPICSCFDTDKNKTSGVDQINSIQSEQNEYYYEMSQKDIDKFLKKFHPLKKGMSVEEVIKVLGQPDNIQEIRGKKLDSPYKGQMLSYYLKKWRKDFVYENKDSYVLIIFDKYDKFESYYITLR